MPPPKVSPSDPFVASTLTQYGATMLAVQIWERELIAMVGAASLKRSGGKPVPTEPALRDAFRKTWKLMHKRRASKLRGMLRELTDGEVVTKALIKEIAELNEWRNFLAHDYLHSQLYAGGQPQADPTLVIELFQIGQAFTASRQRMADATKLLLSGAPKAETPKKVRAAVERLAREAPSVQPAPLAMPRPDASMAGVASSIKLWERPKRRTS